MLYKCTSSGHSFTSFSISFVLSFEAAEMSSGSWSLESKAYESAMLFLPHIAPSIAPPIVPLDSAKTAVVFLP